MVAHQVYVSDEEIGYLPPDKHKYEFPSLRLFDGAKNHHWKTMRLVDIVLVRVQTPRERAPLLVRMFAEQCWRFTFFTDSPRTEERYILIPDIPESKARALLAALPPTIKRGFY